MRGAIAISMLIVASLCLVAVSPAPAAVLCNVNESGCPAESTYEQGEPFLFYGSSGSAVIATNLGNLKCEGAVTGTISAVGGEGKAAESNSSTFTVGECKSYSGFPCTSWAAKNLPYDAKFEGSGGNGTMTVSDPVAVAMEIVCLGSVSCTFSAASIKMNVTGGTPASFQAVSIPLSRSGPNCPATASLTIGLKGAGGLFTGFPSLFIVGGPAPPPSVRLCKQNTSVCTLTNRYPIGTTIEGPLEGSSKFEFLYEGKQREPECEEGTLAGKTTVAGKPLIGEVSALAFSKCGAGVCAVQAQALPFKAEIEKTTGGNGTLAMVSGGSGSPKIEVNCGKSFKCVYKSTTVSFALTGSSTTPKLAVSQTLEKDAASEAECGSTMTWTATYKLTKPVPLFVTS